MNLLVPAFTVPMHIAAAANTSVVALFFGLFPEDCGPFMPPEQYTVLRAAEAGKPGAGIAAITPESVLDAEPPYFPKQN